MSSNLTPSAIYLIYCSFSERSDFAGAAWNTYTAAPAFTLSAGNVTKTVYLQVHNSAGVSNILSDTIIYQIPPPQVTSFCNVDEAEKKEKKI